MSPKKFTTKELAKLSRQQLYSLIKSVQKEEFNLIEYGDLLPGNVMVQDISILTNIYMNQSGCNILMHSLEELAELGPEYYQSFFPKEEINVIVPNLIGVHQRQDPGEEYNFFQRVKSAKTQQYKWYFTTSRLFKTNGEKSYNKMLLIATEVDKMGSFGAKMNKVFEEEQFIKKNYPRFATLTIREKEIIKLLAEGLGTGEISERLFLSKLTINTHRRNIKKKLDITSFAKLMRFAFAFDLA